MGNDDYRAVWLQCLVLQTDWVHRDMGESVAVT